MIPPHSIALVAAFLVSPFGAAERTWKPFNPVLGETFELEGVNDGVSFLAEQACAAARGGAARCRHLSLHLTPPPSSLSVVWSRCQSSRP